MSDLDGADTADVYCAIQTASRGGQRLVGACLRRRLPRRSPEDLTQWALELYDFLDNDQYSNLDCFLVQVGTCILLLPDDLCDNSKADNRKISRIFEGRQHVPLQMVKKQLFKRVDNTDVIRRLVGRDNHETNVAEVERPLGYQCLGCLNSYLKLNDIESDFGTYELSLGSLSRFMRLDSAAVEAVNLLPRPDHPSPLGSVFGILNRCKTKMGQRLLERWLRQPLLDHVEINSRLDIVQLLKENTSSRLELIEGPLRNVPDLDNIVMKLQKNSAGLSELYRVYCFTRSLPRLLGVLQPMVDTCEAKELGTVIADRYLTRLTTFIDKFAKYQALIEHVIDQDRLPDLEVNPRHDADLAELREETEGLDRDVERLLDEARSGWASFTDVKLERNGHQGIVFRTTKPDDERQLRSNNKNVQILSIQKNGLHFTTPALKRIAERTKEVSAQYSKLQVVVVDKVVETARTYIGLIEAAAALVAELDVFASFATTAALAPVEYVRPTIHPLGSGILRISKGRHPCVELMDQVEFIPNDCVLDKSSSNFQIITGPNMGGKSTYIRGVGCLQVMAQVGSFLPCEAADVSVVDVILARVGAGDAVQKGVSTFMAEMLEAAVILQTATENSLIIIDELGRGTSTFDGFGLAWAISEYIVTKLRTATLFATHFYELTGMSNLHSAVTNRHVTAYTENNQVVMLHSLKDGPCSESFGIHVANMAHFPTSVIEAAKRKAAELEQSEELHLGEGEDEGRGEMAEKRRKISAALDQFLGMDFPSVPPSDVQQSLAQIIGRVVGVAN